MSRILFVAIFAGLAFRWARNWRRVVGVTLIATLTVGMVFPPPAYAQFGLLGGIQNILNIINGAIRSALNTIGAVSSAIEALHQQIVWPVQLDQSGKKRDRIVDRTVPRPDAVDLYSAREQRHLADSGRTRSDHSKSPNERFPEPHPIVLPSLRSAARRRSSRSVGSKHDRHR